uniref:Uncharacterized protein n=1 Tax=Callorhinchus milii TaxID=7868 RepID=A0A4W3JPS5_CALMI
MREYLCSLPQGQSAVSAGDEEGELGEYRNKLLSFLEISTHYQPSRLITDFPFDGLLEERALLLGRMGLHEQALFIYVHILHNTRLAEDYCHKHYDVNDDTNRDVYLSLLRMYLSPPEPQCVGPVRVEVAEPQPNLPAALSVLALQYSKLDTSKTLNLLPANTHIQEIRLFLENVLEANAQRRRYNQILKNLLQAEFLRIQEERIYHQEVKCIITEEKICRVCKKKIGNRYVLTPDPHTHPPLTLAPPVPDPRSGCGWQCVDTLSLSTVRLLVTPTLWSFTISAARTGLHVLPRRERPPQPTPDPPPHSCRDDVRRQRVAQPGERGE